MSDNMQSVYDVKTLQDNELYKEYEVSLAMQPVLFAANAMLMEKAKTFKLAGFREGKVPLAIVREQIWSGIIENQVNLKIRQEVERLIEEKKIDKTAKYSVEVKKFDPNNTLEFLVKFNLLPKIPEIDFNHEKFKNLEVFDLKIDDSDMDFMYKNTINTFGTFSAVSDSYRAENGDIITIDFTGTIDGNAFDGNSANNLKVIIGNKDLIDDLERQLIGLRKGDEVSLKIAFPNDYSMQEIAGKEAVFNVKVNELLKSDPSNTISDAFIKKKLDKFGIKNVQELDRMLKDRMEIDFKARRRERLKGALVDILDQICDFNVPDSIVESNFELLLQEHKKSGDLSAEKLEGDDLQQLKHDMKSKMKIGYILSDLIRKFNIQLSEDDIELMKREDIMRNPAEEAKIVEFYNNQKNNERIQAVIAENKLIDCIFDEKASVKKVPVTFIEFNKIQDISA